MFKILSNMLLGVIYENVSEVTASIQTELKLIYFLFMILITLPPPEKKVAIKLHSVGT